MPKTVKSVKVRKGYFSALRSSADMSMLSEMELGEQPHSPTIPQSNQETIKTGESASNEDNQLFGSRYKKFEASGRAGKGLKKV